MARHHLAVMSEPWPTGQTQWDGEIEMQNVIKIEGADLRTLLRALHAIPSTDISTVRVSLDDGVKVKVNAGMWTPPLGESERD